MTKVNDKLQIRNKVLKNRLTMAPTVKFDFAVEDGKATEKHIRHYSERAEHQCGLICVEATAVTPDGRFGPIHMGLWDDSQIEGHKQIVEACHKYGATMLIQLNHPSSPFRGPWRVAPCRGGRWRQEPPAPKRYY